MSEHPWGTKGVVYIAAHLLTRLLMTTLVLIATENSPVAADQLPTYCGAVGAQLQPPASHVQSPIPQVVIQRAGHITVTTTSDQLNGDISSVASLLLRPGPDGISLREAIMAVNNSGGGYLIDFASTLRGQIIQIGPSSLPGITAPLVTINGDTDGDGQPDVTVENNGVTDQTPMGIKIRAGDVTVYAMSVRGFSVGIQIEPLSTGRTYANVAIVNNHIRAVAIAIGLADQTSSGASLIHNGWVNTMIQGNVIESEYSAIHFYLYSSGNSLESTWIVRNELHITPGTGHDSMSLRAGSGAGSFGNSIRNLEITDNLIDGGADIWVSAGLFASANNLAENLNISRNHVTVPQVLQNVGIHISSGWWPGSTQNTIRNVQISDNVIDGSGESVILVAAGDVGSSNNLVEHVDIADNELNVKTEAGGTFGLTTIAGITVIAGDAATDWVDPSFRPVGYGENNLVRDVTIEHNSINGPGSDGVAVAAGNSGNQQNAIEDVVIRNNTITGVGVGTPPDTAPTHGVFIGAGDGTNAITSRRTSANKVQNVVVEHNTIRLAPPTRYTQSAGVGIVGGVGGSENGFVSDVFIARNDINPGGLVGINVIGGYGQTGSQSGHNTITNVQAWCNAVGGLPDSKTPALQGLKGISVLGGFYFAVGNKVDQTRLADNLVGGVLDDYAVIANLSSDSAGNSVTVLPSGTVAKPAIAAAGVVNAASFQANLAAGAWITVFGQNLAPITRSWWDSDFVDGHLPSVLEGVTLRVNGRPGYPSFISPTQINVLAPEDATLGPVQVDVLTSKGGSSAATVDKREYSPGFFPFAAEGGRYLAAVHADGTYVGKQNLLSGAVTRPASPGEVILLFGTGFGQTDPPSPIGEVVDQPAKLRTPTTIRIANVTAEVEFAGLVAAGLYQFNVKVPDVADGDQPVVAEIAGFATQSNVFITVIKQ